MYQKNLKNNNFSLTDVAKRWKIEAGYKAKREVKNQNWNDSSDDQKIVIEIYAYWPNKKRRDMSNMHKILPDALEGIVYEDDRYTLVRDMDFCIDKNNPRIEVFIYMHEGIK